jgi:hypothetical protein
VQVDVRGDVLRDWCALDLAGPDLEQLEADVACPPQLRRRRRQQRLGKFDKASNQPQRPLAECKLRASRCAEKIGREPVRRASGWNRRRIPNPESRIPDIGKQQRRSAGGNDAPVNLCYFKVGVDRCLHRDDVIVTAEAIDEGTKIRK